MTKRAKRRRIYIVVDVWRGIANGARSFTKLRQAQQCVRRLEKGRNLVEDDVGLFVSSIRLD